MKVRSIHLTNFRRFTDLKIDNLPAATLVLLAGPNGSGKSSLFDAFSVWRQAKGTGLNWDLNYYPRDGQNGSWEKHVKINFHGEPNPSPNPKKAFYLRSAYRNEPHFTLARLDHQADPISEYPQQKMVDNQSVVSANYQRLAANAFEDIFASEPGTNTIEQFREKVIADIRDPILRLFPDLRLNALGNPLANGTFLFNKANEKQFQYINLSGGEKAAFDLILDLVVKRRAFDDSVFVIDEPEAHINPKLHGRLLFELVNLIPKGSQLWVATHSIGMMRKAREMQKVSPDDVIFLDFGGQDFDESITLTPTMPTRAFWNRVLSVALDDLSELVAPNEIVLCEGNPINPVAMKNEEHDARCYEIIFAKEFPDTSFMSVGNSTDVKADRLGFAAALKKVARGISVCRAIDRDDHSKMEIDDLNARGVRVLRRRHIESFLYDDEVLKALYQSVNRGSEFLQLQDAKGKALQASAARGNPTDDIKSAAGDIYLFLKKHLGLVGCGNSQMEFARNILAPIIQPEMMVYKELREDIFGK